MSNLLVVWNERWIKWKSVSFQAAFLTNQIGNLIKREHRDPVDMKILTFHHQIWPITYLATWTTNKDFIDSYWRIGISVNKMCHNETYYFYSSLAIQPATLMDAARQRAFSWFPITKMLPGFRLTNVFSNSKVLKLLICLFPTLPEIALTGWPFWSHNGLTKSGVI